MQSLFLRLAGLQSWAGVNLTSTRLQTQSIPTRSGLLGLLACCIGVPIGDSYPRWLLDTRMWVRVERVGEITYDYQTVNAPPRGHIEYLVRQYKLDEIDGLPTPGVNLGWNLYGHNAKGELILGAHATMKKEFLVDAEFIVGIEHDTRLAELFSAVTNPTYLHYLGRKQYVTEFPFVLGVSNKSVLDVFYEMPGHEDRLEMYPIIDEIGQPRIVETTKSSKDNIRIWQRDNLVRGGCHA